MLGLSGFTAPSLAELCPPLHRLRFVPMVCLAGFLQQIVFSLSLLKGK